MRYVKFLIVIAGLHFIYEGILLPMIRLGLRHKLFALRDDLRELLYQKPDELTDEVFRQMEESINIALGFLRRFNVATILEVQRETKNNPNFAKRVQKRVQILESCNIEEFQCIRKTSCKLLAIAIFVNSLWCFLWLIPFVLIAIICGKIKEYCTELKTIVKEMLCLPEREYNRFVRFATV